MGHPRSWATIGLRSGHIEFGLPQSTLGTFSGSVASASGAPMTPDAPGPICCHSWSKDQTLLAVCETGSSAVRLLAPPTEGSDPSEQWQTVCSLQKHEGQASAIDWAPKTNRIVSGSFDGNAYVWESASDTEAGWQPTLVQLRGSTAVLCVAWSASELKFAVGSAARTVSVCYYDGENKWWVSKVIRKKHESSVTSVAWHPGSTLLATTSTDKKCRIFSAAVKEVDGARQGGADGGLPTGKFGEQLLEVDLAQGWTYGVSWSPSGAHLAFAGHDSSLHVLNDVGPSLCLRSLFLPQLPLRALCFLSENALVAAGFDGQPLLFQADAQGQWSLSRPISRTYARKFLLGSAPDSPAGGAVHTGPILSIQRGHAQSKSGQVTTFTTAGLDGRLIMWDITPLLFSPSRQSPSPEAAAPLLEAKIDG